MSSLNRWILRRQRKLIAFTSILFIAFCIYILTFHEDIPIKEEHFQPFSERCLTGSSKTLIDGVCRNFSAGIFHGGFCHALCKSKKIFLDDCIHHGTTYVLLGKHENEDIVIKKKVNHNLEFVTNNFEELIRHTEDISEIHNDFLNGIAGEIESTHGADTKQVFLKNITPISTLLFGKNISELSIPEMRNGWHLVAQDELIVLSVHQNLEAIPRLIGTCGSVYAMERITPYSKYFPEVLPSMSWFQRVKIALGFITLFKEFLKTNVGLLHHCDIQEGNFGLTKDFQVKAIDVDLIYSPNRMDEILPQPKCTTDDQCDFFDCVSKCNVSERICSATLITNNLQVICRDIFLPKWPLSGLLSNFQPHHIKTKLNALVRDCQSPQFGVFTMDHSNVGHMLSELENVLHESLQHKV